jgi:signal transduction histidine kinase
MRSLRRLLTWSWTYDVAVATPFVVAGQLAAWGVVVDGGSRFHGSHLVNAVLAAVLDGLLVLRRRAPATALLALAPIALLQVHHAETTGFVGGFVPVALLVASAGMRESRVRSLAALVYAYATLVAIIALAPDLELTNELPFSGAILPLAWMLGRYLRARERRARSAEARAVELETTHERVLEEERARIARELHDVIAHSVSVMVVQAGAARMLLDEDPASTRGALLAVERAGREALEEMRRLLGMLRRDGREAELVPQPGLDGVEGLLDHVRATGLAVDLEIAGDPQPLPPGVDLSAYRILQEALTNTVKHAHASAARVRVSYDRALVELEVEDDGRGAVGSPNGGHGLVGMRERVELYGGELETGPGAAGGFRVRARLPLEAG